MSRDYNPRILNPSHFYNPENLGISIANSGIIRILRMLFFSQTTLLKLAIVQYYWQFYRLKLCTHLTKKKHINTFNKTLNKNSFRGILGLRRLGESGSLLHCHLFLLSNCFVFSTTLMTYLLSTSLEPDRVFSASG